MGKGSPRQELEEGNPGSIKKSQRSLNLCCEDDTMKASSFTFFYTAASIPATVKAAKGQFNVYREQVRTMVRSHVATSPPKIFILFQY